jgi:hypothetical protein
MSRIMALVVSSFVTVAVQGAVSVRAFAQNEPNVEPNVEPAPGEAAPVEAVPAEPPRMPPPPVAQEVAPAPAVLDSPGVDFAARLGYAVPLGNSTGGTHLSMGTGGAEALVLEVGYRVNGRFTIGGLFQYAVAQMKGGLLAGCGYGTDCSGRVLRVGIEAIYNFNLDTTLTPWVGLGTGYEWFPVTASANGSSGSSTVRGFEFATVHAGGDFRVSPQLTLGPFVSFSLAEYASYEQYFPPDFPGGYMPINDKSMHEWLQLGIRARFGI